MSRNSTAALAAIALVAAVATPLIAAPARRAATPPAPVPADVIKNRIAGFKEMGTAFKNVRDGLRGEPSVILLQQNARTLKANALAIGRWFPAGTGPATGLKTSAKPEIWTKPAEFRAAVDQIGRAATALDAAAASGNVDAIKAAVPAIGAACKNCHDQFKTPDQH